jgi:hypothetical protein
MPKPPHRPRILQRLAHALRTGLTESDRRAWVNLGAFLSWILLWGLTVAVGLKLGSAMVGPQGREGYATMTGLVGIIVVSPLGLLCSIFFLRAKRRVLLFIICGGLVGFAITLWPALAWVYPW